MELLAPLLNVLVHAGNEGSAVRLVLVGKREGALDLVNALAVGHIVNVKVDVLKDRVVAYGGVLSIVRVRYQLY